MTEAVEPMRLRLRRGGGVAADLWRKRWVKVAVIAALLFGAGLALFSLVFARDLPSAEKLLAYEPPLPTNVRDVNGMPIHSYARERRVELSFDEFPKVLIAAFLSAEDKTFFEHGGIDYIAFANGVFEYFTKMGSGERARGGSTITQQVAKNLLVGRRIFADPQDPRGDPGQAHRGCAEQAADPGDLPQPDLPRPQRLWRAVRGARLFRQGCRYADAAGGGVSGGAAQGALDLHARTP
jgi:hypothetical protein